MPPFSKHSVIHLAGLTIASFALSCAAAPSRTGCIGNQRGVLFRSSCKSLRHCFKREMSQTASFTSVQFKNLLQTWGTHVYNLCAAAHTNIASICQCKFWNNMLKIDLFALNIGYRVTI
ncbi:hypothetical protein ILYODFUR_003162 [Ilyodon furcidens]|uniref:Secreted protein n=1 Tax=Ilyodon furcidens TaxID=33524 RepID=A0ABV0U443_9TELE